LEAAPYDVLLLLDCCNAASAVTKGIGYKTMEVLAGCARESLALGPGGPVHGSPFTHCIDKYLRSCASLPHGFFVTELQAKLSFDNILKNQCPVHNFLTRNENPILLKPLTTSVAVGGIEDTYDPQDSDTRVLLSVTLKGNARDTIEKFERWLTTVNAEIFADAKSKIIGDAKWCKIEAGFESSSALLLVSMPVSIWAGLSGDPAFNFLGFITSKNIVEDMGNEAGIR
jgi:hypothetical protein